MSGDCFVFKFLERGMARTLFNKLMSVFNAAVLLLIMNFVSTLSKPNGSVDYFDNVMTNFIVNNRTAALKTDINLFFTITNCPLSFLDASHKL